MKSSVRKILRSLAPLVILHLLIGCGPSGGGSGAADVTVTTPIAPPIAGTVNNAPVALTDTASMSGLSIDLDVLSNDSDPDGDQIKIMSVTDPSHGTASIMDNGTIDTADDFIRYTAHAGYFGPDSFSYSIFDGLDGTASGDVVLTISPVAAGAPIVAVDDTGSIMAGSAKNIPVLGNDSGGNGNPLKIIAISPANHGTAVRADNGTAGDPTDDYIVYISDPGYSGPDTLTYSVTDGDSTAIAAINVVVVAPVPATPPSEPPPAAPPPGTIGGSVLKGPVSGATIQLFAVNADGMPASMMPVAQTITNTSGNWSMLDPLPGQDRLIVANGGSFVDEAHRVDNPATRRTITLPSYSVFEGIMPADDDFLALTVYSNALLEKSRTETTDSNFFEVYSNNRDKATDAYGFDLLSTDPANPISPDPSAGEQSRQYALAAGGAANALNTLGVDLGIVVPQVETIHALVRDLIDCNLDGLDNGAVINVDILGVPQAIINSNDLNLEILRYRNNHFSDFESTPLPVVDPSICGQSGVLPDTTAPAISGAPVSINVANTIPAGVSVTDTLIAGLLSGVTAVDDRDDAVTVSNDAPAILPVGTTIISFSTVDDAGNTSSFTTTVNVIAGNTTPDSIPIGALVGIEDTVFSADLSFFFSDADGDALTYIVDGLPPSMALDLTTGIITGTPTNYDAATAPFTVTATASDGVLAVTQTFTFGVVNVNDAPLLLASAGDQSASLGAPFSLNLGNYFYDADGDVLNFVLSGLPPGTGLSFDPLTGILSGVPANADAIASPLALIVTASDGAVAISDSINLQVINDNNAPQLVTPLGTRSVIEDSTFFLDVTASFEDPDNDSLTFSATGLPASLAINSLTGIISGTSGNDDALVSPITITVSASDGSLSVSDNLILNVVNINDTPELVSPIGLQFAAQDELFSLDVSGNFTDIDNDTLTFSAAGLPASLNIDPATGIISGTPDATAVAASPISITVTAGDGSASVSDTFVLNVSFMNVAPTLLVPIGPQSASQGAPFSLDMNANFGDPDGNTLSFFIAGLPAGTGLMLNPMTGVLSGTPQNVDYLASPSSITITVSDGALSASAAFVLTVANVNDAPNVVSTIVPPLASQDAPFSMNVTANFDDVDGDPLIYSAIGLPASLTLDPATGIISGTPLNADVLASPITISVTASDGALSVSNSFTLTVTNTNDAPTLLGAVVPPPALQGSPFSMNLAGSFNDPDGDALTFSITGLPASSGLILDPTSGFLAGTPGNDDWLASPMTITVTASDSLLSASATFALSVTNLNDAPSVVTAIVAPAATQGTVFSLDVSGNFNDIDGDTLSYSAAGLPTSLTLNPVTGVISGTPTNADYLASPIAITVTADDSVLTVDGSFSLIVNNLNDAPTVVSAIVPPAATQGTAFSLDVTSNFEDIDGDTLSYTITGLPSLTGLSLDPVTGILSGSPSHWDAINSPIALTVTADDSALSVDTGFVLTVVDVNEAPYLLTTITPPTAYEAVAYELDLSSYFADPDPDLLTYTVTGFPGGTGLVADPASGLITGIPSSNDFAASPIAFSVTVEDPLLESVTAGFTINVESLADVDVTMTTLELVPVTGDTIRIMVTLSNYGPGDATNVAVSVPLPAGLDFVSSSPDSGSYNPATGIWSGADVDTGDSEVLDIDVNVSAAPVAFLSVNSQITAADQDDPDTVDSDFLDITVIGTGIDVEWLGGDSSGPNDWANPNNWDSGSVPGNFDEVQIKNGRPAIVLDSDRSVAKIHIESANTLNLNGNTLTVFGEVRADGPVTGSCPSSRIRMLAGKFRGFLPEVEVAGPVETGADATIACDLTITGGRLRLRNDVDVAGNFATLNTGILLQKDGGKELRVVGDVLFDGGNHATQVSGNPPLKSGFIFAGGNFTQTGSPFSFAAEKEHTVVLNGSGPQTVFFGQPDMSNPDDDDPPLIGSRFARLRVDKDAADGAVDFISDVAILKYIEIDELFSPLLTSSTGNQMFAGGMRIEDKTGLQTESAIFDHLPLTLMVGDKLKELDGVLFTNMDPGIPQITIIRPDLNELHDGKSFSNIVFDTFPDINNGGAYIYANNTNVNPSKNLTLEVKTSYPLHGEPWTEKVGNFTIIWGLPTDDTDADGLPDSEEFVWMTDPTDPDADGDGIGDRLELEIDTDPAVAELNVIYVDAFDGDDANDGSSWAQAVRTSGGLMSGPLSTATGTADDPIHILLATGGYDPLTISNTDNVVVIGSLGPTVYYPMSPYDSVLGQGGVNGIVVNDSNNVFLRGVRLSGANNTSGDGGGLSVGGSSGSDVHIYKAEVAGNHSDFNGGGFVVDAGSTLTIEDSLISNNTSGGPGTGTGGAGGAVYGGLTMTNSVIADNRTLGADATDGGGGLLLSNSGAVSVTDSKVVANYAANYGGAMLIENISAPVLIKNNLIIGNAAEDATAGGFEILNIDAGAPLFIESNVIYYNQALILQDISGGLNLSNSPFAEIRNNIIHENQDNKTSDRITDNYMDADGTAIVEYNNILKDPTGGGNGNIDEDPEFIKGLYLNGASLSIDAGSTTAAIAGFMLPYTTHEDGTQDAGQLDQGYHYQAPASDDVKDVIVISSACYAPGELTMVVRPRIEDPIDSSLRISMGPGLLVTVEENDLTPTGKIKDNSALVAINPVTGGKILAIDEGSGDYRFTVVNVNVINDEVEIDVWVNQVAGSKKVKSPKVDTIPGC